MTREPSIRFTIHNPALAAGYSLLLLLVAFVWAAFVANTHRLGEVSGPDYLVHNPVVALPILIAWAVMAYLFSRHYLQGARDPAREGFTLGLVFMGVAVLFDAVVVAGVVGEGLRHFTQLILWIGYAVLLAIPWWVGTRR